MILRGLRGEISFSSVHRTSQPGSPLRPVGLRAGSGLVTYVSQNAAYKIISQRHLFLICLSTLELRCHVASLSQNLIATRYHFDIAAIILRHLKDG